MPKVNIWAGSVNRTREISPTTCGTVYRRRSITTSTISNTFFFLCPILLIDRTTFFSSLCFASSSFSFYQGKLGTDERTGRQGRPRSSLRQSWQYPLPAGQFHASYTISSRGEQHLSSRNDLLACISFRAPPVQRRLSRCDHVASCRDAMLLLIVRCHPLLTSRLHAFRDSPLSLSSLSLALALFVYSLTSRTLEKLTNALNTHVYSSY